LIFKILAFLFLSSAFAFEKDFKTVNDRVPLEFNHLFESLRDSITTSAEKVQLVGICKELDRNLGSLGKEHIYFLMKSEVIKNVLEHKFPKVRSFDMTTFLLERLEEDYAKKEKFLNPFSRWIWRSILAELKARKDMGLISTRSFNAGNFTGAKLAEAKRFERYLNYLYPWIDRMDSLEGHEFNKLSKKVSWVILNRLNERSLLFKRYASTATQDTKVTIFNIPTKLLELRPEDLKRLQDEPAPLTLKEEAEKEKSEASQQVQDVTPDDLSPISDEISKELENKTP
jgi:hypothetical protein